MHNGNGHGNGKRWLLIGLLVLFGFWLVNDSYDDGYRDALVQTGQVTNVRGYGYHGGPHFPWGLVIVGGIAYIAYRKGAFDRFGGPGGPFGGGGRSIRGYGDGPGGVYAPPRPPEGPGPGQGFGPGFRGPRGFFDEWHRQAHEAAHYPPQSAQPAPPAPPAGPPPAQAGGGTAPTEAAQTPPPPPPAPDYWEAMARAAGTTTAEAQTGDNANGPRDAAGPALERW